MSESHREKPHISPRDLVDYLRGTASSEKSQLILKALDDPASDVIEWLRDLEHWAAERQAQRRDKSSVNREIKVTSRLDALVDFVRAKQASNALAASEAAQSIEVGKTPGDQSAPPARAQAIFAAAQMFDKLAELRPELAAEFRNQEVRRR